MVQQAPSMTLSGSVHGTARYIDELLTVREVARHLRVDDTTVRRWIKNGVLEAVTLPHCGKRRGYRVRKLTLDTLLNGPALPM